MLLAAAAAFLVALVCSIRLVGRVRHWALANDMLDIPVARSSHSQAVPRGGGAAILPVVLAALTLLACTGAIGVGDAMAIGPAAAAVAAVGWIDDRHRLSVRVRLAVHLAAAAWFVLWARPPTPMPELLPAAIGNLLLVAGIGWCINLYNFMDGIDGLAASQAVLVGIAGSALFGLAGAGGWMVLSVVVAGASAGFLAWNRPPARIFMGDVGSGLLGFLFAALALASAREGAAPWAAWVLLLGVFVLDATLTLAFRVAAGARWHEPHREHAYQRAVQCGWSHGRVTAAVIVIDLTLCVPAAWSLRPGGTGSPWAAVAAASIMTVLWVWVRWIHGRRARGGEVADKPS
ncbi:MAG: glycosyltransferase family 4 protein [Gammaproteobacteria bacterium]